MYHVKPVLQESIGTVLTLASLLWQLLRVVLRLVRFGVMINYFLFRRWLRFMLPLPWQWCFYPVIFVLRVMTQCLVLLMWYIDGATGDGDGVLPLSFLTASSEPAVINAVLRETWKECTSIRIAQLMEERLLQELTASSLCSSANVKKLFLGLHPPVVKHIRVYRPPAKTPDKPGKKKKDQGKATTVDGEGEVPVLVVDTTFEWNAPDAVIVTDIKSFKKHVTGNVSRFRIRGTLTLELFRHTKPKLFPFATFKAYFRNKPVVSLAVAFGYEPSFLQKSPERGGDTSSAATGRPSLTRRMVLASLDKLIRASIRSGALYPRYVTGVF